ncbi:MAG TPA: YCF48-related protein, partial [Pirellulales bacterium]
MDAIRVFARFLRRAFFSATALACACFALSNSAFAEQFGRAGDAVQFMLDDAELHDVRFLNAQVGWAVGDRAAVWHTHDGGRNWRLVNVGAPPTARLESVYFLDENVGWIAGGFIAPYTHSSNGVLLGTTDGGKTWTSQNAAGLPGLKRAEFFDLQRGWALGRPSSVYQSGLFTTENAGKTWRPAPDASSAGWLTGAFVDLNAGAAAGPNGAIAAVRGGSLQAAQSPVLGARSARAMRFAEPRLGWLVGDGALVLRSGDVGQSWQTPPTNLPVGAEDLFDWKGLAVRGPHLWIAGSPGTRVLHSPDAGQSWQWLPTGWTTPLNALTFLDERRGWAVGALGAILSTQDGGQTWQVQRAGGRRVAILSLFTTPDEVPLELTARLAGGDGYLAATWLGVRTDRSPGPDSRHTLDERLHAAMLDVGGSSGAVDWRFPAPVEALTAGPEAVVAEWNRLHSAGGLAQLERQLVRQLRLWRPEIVLTSTPGDG